MITLPSSQKSASTNSLLREPIAASLVVLLVWVILSYLRFAREEIAPFFPLYDDQGYYLRAAHEYFDYAEKNGFLRLLRAHSIHNTGALGFYPASSLHMSLLASFLFPIFGTGRLGALSILIISWISLLATGAFVFKTLGKSWNYAALIVGLFLSAGFGFVGAGGMFDFRMDFSAACWTGTAILLWCLFIEKPNKRCAASASLVTFGLFFFRILTMTYWLLPLGLLFIYAFLDTKRRSPHGFFKAVPSLALLGVASCVLIFWDKTFIYDYYFTAAMLEAPIRNLAKGLSHDTAGMLLYYPKILWREHLGYYTRLQVAFTFLGLLALSVVSKVKLRRPRLTSVRVETLVFLLFSGFWPLLILTLQPNRAPQVTGILVPPTLIALGLLLTLSAKSIEENAPRRFRGFALISLLMGLIFWEQQLVISSPFQGQSRADAIQYNAILEKTALHERTSVGQGIAPTLPVPQIAFLDWVHGFNHNSVTLYARERLGLKLSFEMEMPRTIFGKTTLELLSSIHKADAVIVPKNPSQLRNLQWPIMESIQNNFPLLLQQTRSKMRLADEFKYGGFEYELYLSRSTPQQL